MDTAVCLHYYTIVNIRHLEWWWCVNDLRGASQKEFEGLPTDPPANCWLQCSTCAFFFSPQVGVRLDVLGDGLVGDTQNSVHDVDDPVDRADVGLHGGGVDSQ